MIELRVRLVCVHENKVNWSLNLTQTVAFCDKGSVASVAKGYHCRSLLVSFRGTSEFPRLNGRFSRPTLRFPPCNLHGQIDRRAGFFVYRNDGYWFDNE